MGYAIRRERRIPRIGDAYVQEARELVAQNFLREDDEEVMPKGRNGSDPIPLDKIFK